MDKWMHIRLNAGYTVEAAGVMSAVLLTVMMLLSVAFHVHEEVLESMKLHAFVERTRHAVSEAEATEISLQVNAGNRTLSITAPVFRPEDSLRMWSLLEENR